MEDPNPHVVKMGFTANDWHLMQECLRAVAENLCNEMDANDRAHVRRRCAEVSLKIDDFVIEVKRLLGDQDGTGTEGVDHHSPGFSIDRAVFGNKRKT